MGAIGRELLKHLVFRSFPISNHQTNLVFEGGGFVRYLLPLIFLAGCLKSPIASVPPVETLPVAAEPISEVKPQAQVSPTTDVAAPVEDPKIAAFKSKVGNFLDEARAGVKLFTVDSSYRAVKKKSEEITELFAHLPDVPNSIPESDEISKKLEAINTQFQVAVEFSKYAVELSQLNISEGVEKSLKSIKDAGDQIKGHCDEIEKAIK